MKYRALRKTILFLGDIFLLVVSLYVALVLRWQKIISPHSFLYFARQFFWLFLFWVFLFFIFDFYSLELRYRSYDFFRYFFILIFLVLFSGILYFYIFPHIGQIPRAIIFIDIIVFCPLFILWRLFFEWAFKRSQIKEKIIFWGNFPEREFLISFIKKRITLYRIVGVFSSKTSSERIKKIIKDRRIKKIVLSPEIKDFQKLFFSFPDLKIESFFDFYEKTTKRIALSSLEDPVVLETFLEKNDNFYLASKRIFDLFIAFFGFLVMIIFFPFIALAIKLNSKGPIFFTQKRTGKKEKTFTSFKFRSMYVHENNKKLWREKHKGEVTSVGSFLRITHLDELPQFLNILKGEMSVVGPRTEWEKLVKKYEKAIPFYFLRHRAKPGLTGWAQLNYPPSTSIKEAKEKLQYDLYYIKNRSFFLDIVIFLKSLRMIFG